MSNQRWQYSIKAYTPLAADIITLGNWVPAYPDFIFSKPSLSRAIRSGSAFWNTYTSPLPIQVDKWIPSAPDYIFKQPTLSQAIKSGSLFWSSYFPETITLDKWLPIRPDYIFGKPPMPVAIKVGSLFFPVQIYSAPESSGCFYYNLMM